MYRIPGRCGRWHCLGAAGMVLCKLTEHSRHDFAARAFLISVAVGVMVEERLYHQEHRAARLESLLLLRLERLVLGCVDYEDFYILLFSASDVCRLL